MVGLPSGLIGPIAALLLLVGPALAQQVAALDVGITGTVTPPSAPASLEGSGAFRRALDLLSSGNPADAYQAARDLPDDTERRTIQWAAVYFNDGAIDYDSIRRLAADAPSFATPALYKSRLESSLIKAGPAGGEVIAALGGAMPNTLSAQIALAKAYAEDGQSERAANIARTIWIDNFLDTATERRVRDLFGSLLTRDDHWARAVHLLMNDRATGTERLMSLLSPAQQSLAQARIAVSRNESGAMALLDRVDPAYREHPLFYFSQAQLARRADRYEAAVGFLNAAKGPLPDAALWWYERRSLTRDLLAVGYPQLAYAASAGYSEGPEGRLVEARFHSGWIALCFLNDAATARDHFAAMAGLATLPDTVTQANYWLGRANLTLGDRAAALTAFSKASAYSTVYYGQLARDALGLSTVALRDAPNSVANEANFEDRELVRAIRLLVENGQKDLAIPLLRQLANALTEPGELALAARLAQALDAHHLAITVADLAEKRGAPLDVFNFPNDSIPAGVQLASVDIAAVYAVARQESRFQVNAVSSSGARGLMQLMPGTARETAEKIGLSYSASRLTSDAGYNALLGSTYLAAQLDRYEGSLVLAAAAYNAGPGNASKWLAAHGDPREAGIDPVVWVELIPFEETRKYVQRVLGNYMVYRARLDDKSMTLNEAIRRIPG